MIRNKIEGVPVIPIFLAEFDENDPSKFVRFKRDVKFPDCPHNRKTTSQTIIEELWYELHFIYLYSDCILSSKAKSAKNFDFSFLDSISETMNQISYITCAKIFLVDNARYYNYRE